MLCKCSGKYIDIYFNLKITYLGNYGVILVSVCVLKAYFREKYEYFSLSIDRSVVLFVF